MHRKILESYSGSPCWHVSSGGLTQPSFLLAFGDKVPRKHVLRNLDQPEEYRTHRGSIELLVWCTWRLQTNEKVLSSSDQQGGVRGLRRLIGDQIKKIDCLAPAWDLEIIFTSGLKLFVFCDHVDPGSSFSDNWELILPNQSLVSTAEGKLISSTLDTEI